MAPLAALACLAALAAPVPAVAADIAATAIAAGRSLAFDRRKGHCLACHAIAGGELPGNVGPTLEQMQARYPDKARLRALIFDARSRNPDTIMPPFGPNQLLSDDEIDRVTDFIHSL